MPVSSENGKSYIKELISNLQPKRILDIGCGCGTYARLFPDIECVGVEIWEPYVDQFGLRNLYKTLIVADARSVDYSTLGHFDVAIAGDVLEHMTAVEAKILLNKLREVADNVIVSIPLGHHPQGEVDGNVYEAHVEDWSDEKVRAIFGPCNESSVNEFNGVYVYSKPKKLKICVYTISKNEEKFVKRWADSAKDADLLLIADTGSTDRTVEIAKECGIQVHDICITPWRFDHARNASIALIPKDMDVCICMDVDEILEPGWREEIERVWTPQTTRLSYFFDWGCGIKFRYEKIHARHGYYWHHPCHEYPVYDKRIKEVYAYTDKLLVSHHPDPTKSRGQYLDLLALSVKEDPICPRNAFYYARELSFAQKWEESIAECGRYLALPGATWENERCYAYRVMGICYESLGKPHEAEASFQKAAAEAPNTREPWCQLAMLYYRQQKWPECFGASMRALSIKDKAFVYTADPAVWGHWAHDLASISAWNMGMVNVALEQGELAVNASPHDQRLVSNLEFMRKRVKRGSRRIPNIIHFMWFTGPKSREFSYINYLAVKIANDVQRPDKILFYYNEDHPENPHWQAMKQYVEMVKLEPPTEWDGSSLGDWPQYQADIVRLQQLHARGGIYLDTDSLLLKPLDDLMDYGYVQGAFLEGFSEGAIKGEKEHMPGTPILAERGADFIRIWLDRMADGLRKGVWAWHCVCLPAEIYHEHPDLAHVIQADLVIPFDFNDKKILQPEYTEETLSSVENAYTVHMWDTIWSEDLKQITPEYLKNVDNAFTRLFKKYA